MTFSVAIWSAAGLLLVGLLQAAHTLLLSPYLFTKSTKDLNSRIDAKKRRDSIAATVFVVITSILSVYTIKDQLMSGQITRDDFDKLEVRVARLEHDAPPGSAQRLSDAEAALQSLRTTLNQYATSKDLDRTREEIKKTIEKIF